LSDIASRLRVRLGESLSTLDEHNRPLPDVSTASLEALKAYSAGELSRSQALLKDLEARFPQDTTVNISYLPALRGLIALQQGKPAEALQKLEPALSNEFALPGTAFFASFGSLYPAYVRGQTYLAVKRPADAAVEFRKIISRRGLVMEDPVDAICGLPRVGSSRGQGSLSNGRYVNFQSASTTPSFGRFPANHATKGLRHETRTSIRARCAHEPIGPGGICCRSDRPHQR
jgi:hypothetical protein